MTVDLERTRSPSDGRAERMSIVAWVDDRSRSAGYAQVTRQPAAWSLELVTDDRHAPSDVAHLLVDAALDAVRAEGGGTVNLWVPRPRPADDDLAADLGLHRGRELFQMRRPLPVGEPFAIDVRPFRPGLDDDAWLRVNNRAFAEHPEQGEWDEATLQARLREPWFDAEGFLLHERDGRLAGFCWTKVHQHESPQLGEIFVIAVDPDFHGMGLGRGLTLAGLDHLSRHGIAVGMLYVAATNRPALALYERLGFTVDHVHRAYTADIAAG